MPSLRDVRLFLTLWATTVLVGAGIGLGAVRLMRLLAGTPPASPETLGSSPAIPPARDPYAEAVASDRPLAWWRLDERGGMRALDASGHGRDGTFVEAEAPAFGAEVAAPLGRGLALGREPDGVRVDALQGLPLPVFSVEAWVRPSVILHPEPVLVVDRGNAWGLQIAADGRAGFAFAHTPGGAWAARPLVPGRPHHLVGTFAGGVLRIWVDGALVGEDRNAPPVPRATRDPIHLGRGLSLGRFDFEGEIDEVALYDRVLPAGRIRFHHRAGRGTAPSPF